MVGKDHRRVFKNASVKGFAGEGRLTCQYKFYVKKSNDVNNSEK